MRFSGAGEERKAGSYEGIHEAGRRAAGMKERVIARPWPALLTVELAADYLSVSVTTIREWLADGKLEPHPLPGIRGRRSLDRIVFRLEEVERCAGIERLQWK